MLEAIDFAGQISGLQGMSKSRPTQVVAVTSGKGGVGKTNITINTAVTLSRMGNRVLVLDADLGLANIDVLLGVYPEKNLLHVIRGEASINDILVEGPDGIRIIPASSGVKQMAELSHAEHAGLIRAFSELAYNPDYLLIDAAAGISDSVITFSRAAHEVVVVVCDEPTSITDAYALIKVMNRNHGVHNFRVVTNMVANFMEGKNLFNKLLKVTDRFLDVTLDHLGSVPYDDYLKKSVQRQNAVVSLYPRSKAAISFGKISSKVESLPHPGNARGHIEFFFERLFNY